MVYAQYQQKRAQARAMKLSTAGKLWDDEDFESMKMDAFCKEIRDSLDEEVVEEQDEQPVRIFRLWKEKWEKKHRFRL